MVELKMKVKKIIRILKKNNFPGAKDGVIEAD